jgi:hypothetical protein
MALAMQRILEDLNEGSQPTALFFPYTEVAYIEILFFSVTRAVFAVSV